MKTPRIDNPLLPVRQRQCSIVVCVSCPWKNVAILTDEEFDWQKSKNMESRCRMQSLSSDYGSAIPSIRHASDSLVSALFLPHCILVAILKIATRDYIPRVSLRRCFDKPLAVGGLLLQIISGGSPQVVPTIRLSWHGTHSQAFLRSTLVAPFGACGKAKGQGETQKQPGHLR